MTRQRGFTLTDILVTVFIIAALVSIALPILGRMHRSAQASRKKADLNTITVALEAFKAKHGDYPRMDRKTLAKFLPRENFVAEYNAFLDSQTRGSQLLTMALLDGGFLDSSFRTVEVYDEALQRNVRLLATHDDRPILYYPALPVRLNLSRTGGYVASMGPQELQLRRQQGPPLYNVWDNQQFVSEPLAWEMLGANTGENGTEPGSPRQSAVPKYCSAYLLWAAGDHPDIRQAYQDERAILLAGGGPPLVMLAGGPGDSNVAAVAYANYSTYVGFGDGITADPTGEYLRPDLTGVGGGRDPGSYVRPPPPAVVVPNEPPPGWTEHEIPPRTPAKPPADAIDIVDRGAKPNDGVDDWQIIRDALEEARQQGKAIVIPEGTFDISRPLVVSSGSQIYGPGTLNLRNPGSNYYSIVIPGNSNGIFIDGVTLNGGGVKVDSRSSNITFTNNIVQNVQFGEWWARGFDAPGGLNNSKIEQNHFFNIKREGVWIDTNASGTSVSYNYFENVWQPLHIISSGPATDIRLNHNYGVGMIRMGIEFQGDGAIDSQIIGNTFRDWNPSEVYHGSFGLSIYNMGRGTQVLDNMLHGYDQNPLGIELGGHESVAQGNFVSGFREGMHVIHADNSVVSGNTFVGQRWMSIWFPGYGSAYNTVVANNHFEPADVAEAAILFMGGGWGGTNIYGNTAKLSGGTEFVKSHSGTGGLTIGENEITR